MMLETLGVQHADLQWEHFVRRAISERKMICLQGICKTVRKTRWKIERYTWQCQRCGSDEQWMASSACTSCGLAQCVYCTGCLGMGKVRQCSTIFVGITQEFIGITQEAKFTKKLKAMQPSGKSHGDNTKRSTSWNLSQAQLEAVEKAKAFVRRKQEGSYDTNRQFLIWAVTGAGKTEMIFPLIESTIRDGGRVVLATPRQDVVKELFPRLQHAFSEYCITALYGGAEHSWELSHVTIATTHQLLRFHQAFDLVIVDELDAFPYHGNPILQTAVKKAGKQDAPYVLLSATPPASMQRAARRGTLAHARVPVRYHGHPLPVPQRIRMRSLRHSNSGLPLSRLIRLLEASVARGAQCFVFVPRIEAVDPLVASLGRCLPSVRIEGTSSRDAERAG